MITLADSGIIFNEEEHTYTLNGKQLSGITGLLHEKLFSEQYTGIPAAVLEAAAKRGSHIHKLTELYDAMGVSDESVEEVQGYIRLKTNGGYNTVQSEYIVTDGKNYASAIDVVWTQDDESVVLVDKKTTSKYYGDSVEWQLSIYAYMFELMNPTVKVSGLYGCWLRGDKAKLYPAKRHGVEEIQRLLQSGVDGTEFIPDESEPCDDEQAKLLMAITTIDRDLKLLKERREEHIAKLMQFMTDHEQSRVENDDVMVIRKEATIASKFDSARFQKEHADLYGKYMKEIAVKGSITVKLK